MAHDDHERGSQRAWIVALAGALYVVAFLAFALYAGLDTPPAGWDMGGTPFVPASSNKAEGYFQARVPAPKAVRP